MIQTKTTLVKGRNGLRGKVESFMDESAAGDHVVVALEQGGRIAVPRTMLQAQPDGTFSLPLGPEDIERYRHHEAHAASSSISADRPSSTTVPLAREDLRVGTQRVETGKVVVHTSVREREELVDEPLVRELVDVERRPVNRFIDGPVDVREEGDAIIVPLIEEVLVVEKRLLLREELHITRRREAVRMPQRFTLRSEEARVDRIDTGPQPAREPSSRRTITEESQTNEQQA